MELARRIAVVGVGETRYERRSSRDPAALRREAACAALADAGLEAAAVDGLIVPGAGYGELHELARDLGIRGQFHAASCFHSGTAVVAAPLELEGYLASPYLAEPFRAPDCCLVNDGAGAFVMTSLERARDGRARPVVVLGAGSGVIPDGEYSSLREDYLATGAVHSAPRAFGMAGLSPADVDFVALYDNFTGLVIQRLEDLGLCRRGEGGPFVEGGRIELGGALPVNPSGGQLAQAFVFSTNHVVEAVCQLRGEAGQRQIASAEVGVVTGYTGAQHATLVLGSG